MARIALAVTAALLTAGTTACGGAGTNQAGQQAGGPDLVQAAYTTTAAAKTAKVSLQETIDTASSAAPSALHLRGTGVLSFASKDLDLTLTPPSGADLEVRKIGSVIYVRVPAQARAKLPGHTPWVALNVDKLVQHQYGATLAQLQGGMSNDPGQLLSYLRGASNSVRKVGTAMVRGVPTTHYHATVNLDKAAQRKDAQAQQAIPRLEQQLGTHTLPVDVWLDRDGRVRQLQMSLPLPSSTGSSSSPGPGGKIAITEDLYDFGTPVHVSAPAAGQTTDITQQLLAHLPAGPA